MLPFESLSASKAFLGKAVEGERLFLKALRLNPYRNTWYYPYGSFTYFVQQQYDKFFKTALKGPLTDVWIDLPAFLAAAYALTDHRQEASHYLDIFIDIFTQKISSGHRPQSQVIIDWMTKANPFKLESDAEHMIQGVVAAGLKDY